VRGEPRGVQGTKPGLFGLRQDDSRYEEIVAGAVETRMGGKLWGCLWGTDILALVHCESQG